MPADTNRKVVLRSYPKGAPGADNFEIVEEAIPAPGPGEVLVRAIYLTVDPYMRGRLRPGPSYAEPQKIGAVMVGEIAGQVLESNAQGFAKGDYVTADTGWQTHGVADRRDLRKAIANALAMLLRQPADAVV